MIDERQARMRARIHRIRAKIADEKLPRQEPPRERKLWPWYVYAIGGALIAAGVALATHPMSHEREQYVGGLVTLMLLGVYMAGIIVWGVRTIVASWFTPEHGRLLYFLMFVMAVMVIGGYLSQPSAQSERISAPAAAQAQPAETPAERALQELAPVEPSALRP
jgi:hypothetical protein